MVIPFDCDGNLNKEMYEAIWRSFCATNMSIMGISVSS